MTIIEETAGDSKFTTYANQENTNQPAKKSLAHFNSIYSNQVFEKDKPLMSNSLLLKINQEINGK